ncbi:Hypothetical_protein [Hexamita inflata]|uniref:Hypothetical_protein n=1 Tax=Hexamita inflata TaxID=28002 RepID=A0AA86NUU4_9EUKA|nr:Hypothetical protein HINF_LOCUS12806 [Hexamita inflata]
MLLSDGSVTCLRTQELTIEFMVVSYVSVYQKVLQYSIGCFRFIRAKFKLSNLCFSVSFGFILATQKLKLNLARRRDTVVRDMEIPRRAQYFSAMIRRVSNLWLWRYLTTRKSQLSQIF